MSDSGDEKQQGRRRGNSDEKELASQLVQIQSKRFYIDVKENKRGRFIKLAEVGIGGRKSRILMTMGAAAEFKTRLIEFSELHTKLGPSSAAAQNAADSSNASPATQAAAATATEDGADANADTKPAATTAAAAAVVATTATIANDESAPDNSNKNKTTAATGSQNSNAENGNSDGGLIKSETIIKDRKRYYLDLKENQRGRFLRVSMVLTRGPRAYLAIPAQGLIEFKDHLSDMLDRYGDSGAEESPQAELPESKSLRADNKTFYFDCGSNGRGVFLKISEVRQNRYRTSITIPEKFLQPFRDFVTEFVDNAAAAAAAATAATGAASVVHTSGLAIATSAATTTPAPNAEIRNNNNNSNNTAVAENLNEKVATLKLDGGEAITSSVA